jgi:hypothetical protein
MKRIASSALLFLLALAIPTFAQQKPYETQGDVLGETVTQYQNQHRDPLPKSYLTLSTEKILLQNCKKNCDALLKKDDRFDCAIQELSQSVNDVRSCSTSNLSDMVYADIRFSYKLVSFYKDSLYLVTYSFQNLDNDNLFPGLKAALVAKYGVPNNDGILKVQNGLGNTFDNEVMVWTNGVSTLTLIQRDNAIDTTTVTFILDAAYKEVSAKQIHAPSGM